MARWINPLGSFELVPAFSAPAFGDGLDTNNLPCSSP